MQKWLPIILIGLGTFFLAAAVIFGWVAFPKLYEKGIRDKVQLDPNGETFEKWRNITSPITISYYIYNITNSIEDIMNGEYPVIEEVGPYVYREKRLKTILAQNDEDDTVTYQQSITYFFDPELSNGTLDDLVTVPDIPMLGIANRILKVEISRVAAGLINADILERNIIPYTTITVDELLFKGYKPPIIQVVSELQGGIDILPNNTFSLNMGKNGSLGGEMEVKRGMSSSEEFGKVVRYKNETELDFWPENSTCNALQGTDGSIFPPFVTKDRVVSLFSDDLCRSLYLYYEKDVEYLGIPGYRFALPEKLLQRASDNPDNLCFCIDPKEDASNCKAGIIELAGCKKGTPIVASTPHFLFGEPTDSEIVHLTPDYEKHITYIDIEPNSGVMLQARKRIQINIKIAKNKKVHHVNKLKEMLHPVMWADESAMLNPASAELLKSKLLDSVKKVEIAKWAIIGLSCLLIVVGLLVLMVRMRTKKMFV